MTTFEKKLQKTLAAAYTLTASAIKESPYESSVKDCNQLIDNILYIKEKYEQTGTLG